MQCLHEASDHLWVAGVLATVFTDLAGVVVEWPRLSDLGSYKFDDDVHRAYVVEVVGEMRADAKRRLHILLCFMLQCDGPVGVESVGEDDLLCLGVDA